MFFDPLIFVLNICQFSWQIVRPSSLSVSEPLPRIGLCEHVSDSILRVITCMYVCMYVQNI